MRRAEWWFIIGTFTGCWTYVATGQWQWWFVAYGITAVFELVGAFMAHVRRDHSFHVDSAVERERRAARIEEWESWQRPWGDKHDGWRNG